jgi:hypothetical protein
MQNLSDVWFLLTAEVSPSSTQPTLRPCTKQQLWPLVTQRHPLVAFLVCLAHIGDLQQLLQVGGTPLSTCNHTASNAEAIGHN